MEIHNLNSFFVELTSEEAATINGGTTTPDITLEDSSEFTVEPTTQTPNTITQNASTIVLDAARALFEEQPQFGASTNPATSRRSRSSFGARRR